jgi:basic amino acid/polyamine antiporter, APA family
MHADERLTRAIGPWSLGANAVNMSVGAGIFALPAAVAAILGPAAILAYLVCGLAIGLVLTCFAELGTRVTRSGGAVAYIEDSFGPMAGFVAWVVFTLGFCTAANAAVGAMLIDAVATVAPAVGSGAGRAAALAAIYAALAAVNIAGVRAGARLAVGATAAKLLPLLIIVAAGALAVDMRNLRWSAWPSVGQIGEASLVLFFAYSGAECAVTPSGEIRDPSRTVPRGLLGAAGFLVALYCSVQLVSQGVLGPALDQHGGAPLAAVAGRLFGAGGSVLVLACTVLATAGLLAGDLLATPRSFLPMADDGMLPAALGSVHPGRRTPHVAIAAYAATACLFAISGTFRPLAVLASVSLLLVYLVVCVAALKMRAAGPAPVGAFRAPGGPLVPVLGAATVGWLLLHATRSEAAAIALAIGAAAAYYLVRRQALRGRAAAQAAGAEGP